jgi:uncharacterized membrane protein
MSQAHHQVRIDRPIEEVFDFLAAGTDNPRWQRFVISTTPPEGAVGQGSTFRQRVRHPLGFTVSADYRVTTYQRPSRLAVEIVSGGPIRPTLTYDLAPTGESSTDLRCTVAYRPSGLGRLASPAFALLHPLFAWEASSVEQAQRLLDSTGSPAA